MTDREIFIKAPLDGPPEALETYLVEACGGDEELEAKVRELIAEAGEVDEFMERAPLGESAPTAVDGSDLVESAGSTIGHYKLLQQIGEGGFGVVYMAEQLRPVKRRVALKVIKAGMDTKQVVARFEAERQALAMMDHPNIAKVHDAGSTEAGRPYFVMELVRGVPITEYCDENNLSTEERLELFIAVCQAVQHAHQKGVIHRDLKPSNVMISLHDDKAVPKVIDFGVAKATQMDLTDKTLFTHFEQFIGTPAYMSPEQAQLSGLDIDTRSDIYALGVLLYELLTGTTPFDSKELMKAGMDEVRRVIREEEAPRPSIRLSTMGGAARTHLAKHRKAAPDKLMGLLRGDLDWIVMRALEKDRARRYESANGFAEDIRRHLADEPVSAAAPSAAYRIGKYVRRHRAGLGVAAVIAILLVAGTVVSSWMAIEATNERRKAETAKANEKKEREKAETARENEVNERRKAETARANEEEERRKAELSAQAAEEARRGAEEAQSQAEAAALRAEMAQLEAESERRRMAYRLVDEDVVRGRLELGRFIEKNLDNRAAAERVMSTLWQRESIMPLSPPLVADHAAITHDGKYAALGTERDRGTLQIVNAETGELVSPEVITGSVIAEVGFSSDPEQRRIITRGVQLPSRKGLVEVWEWKNDDGSIKAEPERVGSFLHDNMALFAELSPDGAMVLTGVQTQKYGRVWMIESGETRGVEAATVVGNRGNRNTNTGCWSPDGTRVATAGTPSGMWQIDEIRDGRVIGEPVINRAQPHGSGIKSIRFSPDGERVVTASIDDTAQVWDARTGEPVGKRLIHAEVVSFAEFSPDGERVLTASFDRTVRLWDAQTGELLLPPFEHPGGVEEAHFSPDGQLVMSDCEDKHFRIWSAVTGELVDVRLGAMREAQTTTTHGRLAEEGRHVLFWGGQGRDGGRRLWPLRRSRARHQMFRLEPKTIWDYPGKIPTADFHPTESLLVSASRDQRVRLWNRDSGELIQSLWIPTEALKPVVRFSPDGDRILVTSTDEGLRVSRRTPSGWTMARRFGDREEDLFALIAHADFSPSVKGADGSRHSRWIVSCKVVLQKAEVWDVENGELKATLQLDSAGGRLCAFASFSHDGRRVVTTDLKGWVQIWEGDWGVGQETVRKVAEFKSGAEGGVVALFHSTDRNRVLCANRKGHEATIWVIDPVTNNAELAHRFKHDLRIRYAEWSPDGARVVTASHDGTAQVWDVVSGDEVGEPLRHDESVVRAEFSPDGKRVVTASHDGTARVWDAATGYPLSDPLHHHSPVNSARFSPDGRQVVTTGDDATVRLWDVPPAPPGPAPTWLPEFVEAVSGMRIEVDGSVTWIDWETRKKIQAEIEALAPDDYYVRAAQWYYRDPETRPITPFSEVTIDQYVANRIRENTEVSLKEALEADPGNREALSALAELVASAPMQSVDNLRLAVHHAKAASRTGDGNAEMVATIASKLRFAQAKERIESLKKQAAEYAAAGDPKAAESTLGTAILGWVLCSAEFGKPDLAVSIESHFPMLRAILDEQYAAEVLIQPGAKWRFPAMREEPGKDWATCQYDDLAWQEGRAPLGFSKDGEDGENTKLAKDDSATTYFFRHTFEWEEDSLSQDDLRKLMLRIRCDDGAVIFLNGVEAQRVNMPEGEINRETPARNVRGGEEERRWTEHLLDRGLLLDGPNVLAVEVHQKHGEKRPSSDLMLDLELKLQRGTSDFLRSLAGEVGDRALDELAFALLGEANPGNRERWAMALAEETRADLAPEDLNFRVRVQGLLNCWDGALEALEKALELHGESFEPAKLRRKKELLRAKFQILTAAQRSEEAKALRLEILNRPPRNPALSQKLINLDAAKAAPGVYRGFFVPWNPAADSEQYWRERFAERFPVEKTGEVEVEFDIRGRIALNSGRFKRGEFMGKTFREATGKQVDRPDSVEIPVKQAADKLHFLQWCDFSLEPEGVEVAHYLVHYEDGTEPERIPVIFGKDVADLDIEIGSTPPERIAWEHSYKWAGRRASRIALGIQTWENPHPDKVISHVDFVSAKEQAVPVLVAMTVE